MTDKEIAERIRKLLPTWRKLKKTDSIFESSIIMDDLYITLAKLLEELSNE